MLRSPNDSNRRPVVFDVLGPDRRTSILPDYVKMVLHVNPKSMNLSYTNLIETIQTDGGFVEQHWGSSPTQVSFEMATGGFMRLFTGPSAVTGPGPANSLLPASQQAVDLGGTRRDTLAYDKYLDLLALFHANGSVYDTTGRVVYTGQIKLSFDGHTYWGWFESFSVQESSERPYLFDLSASFVVEREAHLSRSSIPALVNGSDTVNGPRVSQTVPPKPVLV